MANALPEPFKQVRFGAEKVDGVEVFYREAGSRKLIGKIHMHLQKRGARHAWVRSAGEGDWELVIRRKDFPIAAEVVPSNA